MVLGDLGCMNNIKIKIISENNKMTANKNNWNNYHEFTPTLVFKWLIYCVQTDS